MELSIGQVARRCGISARMLRHYDTIGLFTPARVSANGYRWYDQTQLPRLYRIIALRHAGLGLTQIHDVLAEHTAEAAALREHLVDLRDQHDRLGELIGSIEREVDLLERLRVENPAEFDAAYRRERADFVARLRARYGNAAAAVVAGDDEAPATHGDLEHLAARNAELLSRFDALRAAGSAPTAGEVLDLVAEHRAAVGQHWTPTPQAYRAIGEAYLNDPLQHSIVAAVDAELPAWLAGAIDAYVTQRLGVPRATRL